MNVAACIQNKKRQCQTSLSEDRSKLGPSKYVQSDHYRSDSALLARGGMGRGGGGDTGIGMTFVCPSVSSSVRP